MRIRAPFANHHQQREHQNQDLSIDVLWRPEPLHTVSGITWPHSRRGRRAAVPSHQGAWPPDLRSDGAGPRGL